MRITKIAITLTLCLWGSLALAAGHGGDGQQLGGDLSQMASDGSAEGPGTEISEGGSSGPAPLSAPTTVPNNTVRSVPDRPGENRDPIVLDHKSTMEPRSPASMKIYESAYNADLNLVNKWLKTFAR